jgi:hypothetical protein
MVKFKENIQFYHPGMMKGPSNYGFIASHNQIITMLYGIFIVLSNIHSIKVCA